MTYEEWQSNQRAVPDPALAALISIRHGSNFASALITLLGATLLAIWAILAARARRERRRRGFEVVHSQNSPNGTIFP